MTASPSPPGPEALLWDLDGRLLEVLEVLCREAPGSSFERVEAGAYVVLLPGERRPSTVVWFLAGPYDVRVEVFVLHVTADCADPGPLHRLLLSRNLALRDVHFALDEVGDVFLTGSLPHTAVDVTGIDRALGEILALLEADQEALVRAAYGDLPRPGTGGGPERAALAAKAWTDGAGRRPAGTPVGAPRRDVRR